MLTGGSAARSSADRSPPARPASPSDETGQVRRRACSAAPKDAGRRSSQQAGQRYRAPTLRAVLRRDARGCVRPGAVRDGAVLLPARPEDLSRHLVLPRLERASAAATRQQVLPVRAGLRDRARGRPSRAEPARHPAEGAAAQQRGRQQGRGEPHPGAGRAAGRLLRRRLGEPVRPADGKFIEPGDVEAALRTAAAIGDDRLQKQAQGYVVPDSFTHGTSEQRQRWFNTGFKTAQRSRACNTLRALGASSSARICHGRAVAGMTRACPASTKRDNSSR